MNEEAILKMIEDLEATDDTAFSGFNSLPFEDGYRFAFRQLKSRIEAGAQL